ncbi:MAG: glycoside hydrolase domain-containing protein [Candidatus Brocadiia bacterium]
MMVAQWSTSILALMLLGAVAGRGAEYRVVLMDRPPRLDGHIEEGEWAAAAGFDGFAFRGQLERRRARGAVGATRTHLYLAIASQLPAEGPLLAQVEKDTVKVVYDDSVEVWVDPTPGSEHGQVYQMLANAIGHVGYKHHARGREKEKPTWRGNWQVANGFHDGWWHCEVAVPIEQIAPGRTADQGAWGLNLCRNWKQPWAFSSLGGGAYAPSDRFVFAARDALAVAHESRGERFLGRLHEALALRNPSPQRISVKAEMVVERDAMPTLRESEPVALDPGETKFLTLEAADQATRKFRLAIRVASLDGATVHYQRTLAWRRGEPWRWTTTKKEVLPIDFQFAYYPYRNRMRVRINTANLPREATLDRLLCMVRKKGVAKPVKTVTIANGFARIPGERQVTVRIDRDRARELGLTAQQIATAVRKATAGLERHRAPLPQAVEELADTLIETPRGPKVRLHEVAELGVEEGTAEMPVEGDEFGLSLTLPPLEGDHEIAVRAEGTNVPQGELVKPLERTVFDWERQGLGTSTKVYPPFTPIRVEGKKVATVLREHTMNDQGLWDQVVARGKPLLAAPMRLVAGATDEKLEEKRRGLAFTTTEEHAVAGRAAFELGALRANPQVTWDYDGTMRVDLELSSEQGQALSFLDLEIPLRNDAAPMIHAMGDGIRNTIYTRVPEGEGVVWDASKVQVNDFPRNWCSYIYVGGPVRGLSWFAENDAGWSWDREKPNLDLVRKGDQLILRVHLINKPTVIDAPRTITFGLLAAPVKPRIANWRYIWHRENYTLLGTDINWLARGNCGSVYPAGKDLYLWEMLKRGNQEKLSREEVQKVIDRGRKYFEPYGPEYVERFERHVPHNLLSRYGKRMVFYYNRASCQLFPEFQTFQDEWCLTDYRTVGSGNGVGEMKIVPSPSYIDHALWWYGKSFEVGGNQGVYWDNMFFRASYNTAMTAAYERPDGSIMPSNGLWGLRELVKRTFVHMNERGMRPVTMAHMTSTGILPILSFCTVQYDWEWKYSQGDVQYRFPREYILLVSTGELAGTWPVLLGDHGKLARDEWTQRTFAAVCLVHELDGWGGGKAWRTLFNHVHRLVESPGLEVYRYWDDRPQPVDTGHPDLPAIVYSLPGKEAIIGVTSYAERDVAAAITIDPKPLGLADGYRVTDAETGEPVPCQDDTLELTIRKHDVRELRLLPRR